MTTPTTVQNSDNDMDSTQPFLAFNLATLVRRVADGVEDLDRVAAVFWELEQRAIHRMGPTTIPGLGTYVEGEIFVALDYAQPDLYNIARNQERLTKNRVNLFRHMASLLEGNGTDEIFENFGAILAIREKAEMGLPLLLPKVGLYEAEEAEVAAERTFSLITTEHFDPAFSNQTVVDWTCRLEDMITDVEAGECDDYLAELLMDLKKAVREKDQARTHLYGLRLEEAELILKFITPTAFQRLPDLAAFSLT